MRLLLIALTIAVAPLPASPAAAQNVAGAFSQGRTHFVVSGGAGYAFNHTYLVLGLGGAYYLLDGLNVGLHVESWSGSSPSMYKVTPSVQYVFHNMTIAKPYLGAFYRRTFISDRSDLDSAGARAGAYFEAGRNTYVGAGVVYESYLDCNQTVYRSCSSTYGELSFTVAF
jgi:hypothetical protein